MQLVKTKFKGLIIYKRPSFIDSRGYFRELFLEKIFKKKFIFDYFSLSKKNVIRGIHMQLVKPQGKLITVLSGKIFDVAVDLRKNSKTYLKYYSCELSEKNNTSIYIPPGFAHGFYCYNKENIVLYGSTNYRHKNSEKGIIWNDKDLKIKWPKKKYIISARDRKNLPFKRFISEKIIEK